MDALMAQAIRGTAEFRKTSVPWTLDEPYPQCYYGFDPATSTWISKPTYSLEGPTTSKDSLAVTTIALYTWNIDFILPFAAARMRPALAHLHQIIRLSLPNVAPVIFLQECTPSDFETIAATPWVRDHFYLTDIDTTNWATTQYGTTILISKHLPITSVFRVHYSLTRMDRDAHFVDVLLGPERKRIRLCNTHLESMALDPPYRPPQMQIVSRYMHQDGVDAAISAGDFNAIQPFDRTLHVDNNLKDAFLELGGREDTEEGYTWGQQATTAQRAQFGCSRMDKVYFRGDVKLVKFARFGQGVLVEGDDERKQIVELGFEKPWITDHLGVMAEVEVLLNAKGQL
jgi:tyrosyl-DNA phosphodiesterase 2